jgi:membrane protein
MTLQPMTFKDKAIDIYQIVKQAIGEWYADNTFQIGAALAYYTVFSLTPLLLITIAVGALFFGEGVIRGQIAEQIEDTAGTQVAGAVDDMLKNTVDAQNSKLATIVGFVVLFFSSAAVFTQLQHALNTVWGVKARDDVGWLDAIKARFWSFTVVLVVGLLLLSSVVIDTTLARLSTYLTPEAEEMRDIGLCTWRTVNWIVSFALITLLFAIMYKLLPDVKLRWRDVWVGAAVTAVLFTIGKYLIGLYLAHSVTVSAYGAAASLVVILLWVFYSSQIFLFGAEFTKVYADKYGRPVVSQEMAEPVTKQARARQGMGPSQHHGLCKPVDN